MKTFVVGDIHGAHKALVQVLERSGFDYEKDMLITIGDICDGWGETYETIEELLKIKNRIDIMGNHDQWMYEFITTGVHPDQWSQGGLATAKSYANALGMELIIDKTTHRGFRYEHYSYRLNLIPEDITISHQNFFKRQAKWYKDDNNNLFVHGGINRHIPLNDNLPHMAMWDRALFSQAMSAAATNNKLKFHDEYKKIFIGHTTTESWGKTEPLLVDIIWNLDTGAGGGGKLTLMDIDTEEYWQSDLVPSLYPDDEHNLRK